MKIEHIWFRDAVRLGALTVTELGRAKREHDRFVVAFAHGANHVTVVDLERPDSVVCVPLANVIWFQVSPDEPKGESPPSPAQESRKR